MWINMFFLGLLWQITSRRSSDRGCHFQCSLLTHAGKTYKAFFMSKYLLWFCCKQDWFVSLLRNLWLESWHCLDIVLLFSVLETKSELLCFPVRIQYCSQEIVVIREDLVNKMCRNCVRLPSNNLDIPNHVSFSFSEQTFMPSEGTLIKQLCCQRYYLPLYIVFQVLSSFLSAP